jgi:hypothetical protein
VLGHNHDDRYYTESETNSLLAAKAPTTHAHAIADLNGNGDSTTFLRGDEVFARPGNTPVASTVSTEGLYDNQWAKIAVATLPNQYADATLVLRILGMGNGSNTSAHARIIARVKQEVPLGTGAPFYSLYADELFEFTLGSFAWVITQNNGVSTIAELWVKAPRQWEQYFVHEDFTQSAGSGVSNFAYVPNAPFQTTLPSGPSITASAMPGGGGGVPVQPNEPALGDGALWWDSDEESAAVPDSGWVSYVPTLTRGGAMGNAVRVGGYVQIGKTVHFWAQYTLGTTSTITGVPGLSLPLPPKGAYAYASMRGEMTDYGVLNYPAYTGLLVATSEVLLYPLATNGAFLTTGAVSATSPFTWTTNDFIELHGTYEAA